MDLSHDSPDSAPTTPTPDARIRCALGVRLSAEQLELLGQAFHDCDLIFVKREFRSGYSGAIVLLVSLGADQAPLVVKLAHPIELEREYQAYQQFVRQISPQNIAHLQGEPLLSADRQLGLIQYSFAGGESHQAAASLRDYYESNGGSACAAVLNRIFRAYGRYWWANNRPELYTLGEQYDRLLPVHLQVAKVEATATPTCVLEPGKTSLLTVRQLQIGDQMRLLNFRVLKVQADGREITLVAPPPPNEASAMLRIRLELSEDEKSLFPVRPGDTVAQVDVVVTATRHSLLCAAAIDAAPSFDPSVEAYTVDIGAAEGELRLQGPTESPKLINPIYDLSGLLDQVVETKFSTIHGDLNLQNILVDTPTGFAWLVDFSETRRGPTLLDLQRVEVQVLTKMLPEAIRQGELKPAAVAQLVLQLHADPLPSAPPEPALQEPFHVLVTIRRLARQYLIDDLDWDEYYRGLIVTLVGALKYKELDALARTLALTAAATMQGLLGHRLETSQTAAISAVPPPPSRKPVTPIRWIGLAVGVVVILLFGGALWQFWPRPATPLPEATPIDTPAPTPMQTPVPTPLQAAAPTPTGMVVTATLAASTDALAHVGVYADDLAEGWEDEWSWDADIANDSTDVFEGTSALRVAFTKPYGGLSLRAPTPVDSSEYQAVDFWVYRASGDSQLGFYTMDSDDTGAGTKVIFGVPRREWTHVSLSLEELGSPAQIVRLNWQEESGDNDAVFYLDDIRITELTGDVATGPTPTVQPSPPEPTPLPVMAAEGETLLLVSQFTSFARDSSFNVAGRIEEALETQLAAAQLMDTRVAVWPDVIDVAATADSVLNDTGAAMIIWGEYDSGRIRVNFALPSGQDKVGWQRLLASPSELSTTINLDVPREVQALALLTVGRLYRAGGDVAKARAAFEQALAQNPGEANTVATLSFYLGYLYADSPPPQLDKAIPQLDKAITAYSRAIELRPNWRNPRYNRGLAYYARYWYNGKVEELDAAIADYGVVLEARPGDVEPLINRGIAYYTRNQPGDLALAIDDFDTAISQDSQSLKGYYNRGLAYIRANDRPAWEADLMHARELRPNYIDATHALCWGYALDNLPEQGLPYCDEVEATNTGDNSRDARGLIQAELGNLDKAAEDFEAYLTWLGEQPDYRYEYDDGAIYAGMIDVLRAGENPITAEILASLR